MTKWEIRIKKTVIYTKLDDLHDYDQAYIDLDNVLSMYLEEHKLFKRNFDKTIQRIYQELNSNKVTSEFLTDRAFKIVELGRQSLAKIPKILSYSGPVTTLRALIYAFMIGNNGNYMNEFKLLAGFTRYGVNNPTPTVRKRIA